MVRYEWTLADPRMGGCEGDTDDHHYFTSRLKPLFLLLYQYSILSQHDLCGQDVP
jgi:hypothetical protein